MGWSVQGGWILRHHNVVVSLFTFIHTLFLESVYFIFKYALLKNIVYANLKKISIIFLMQNVYVKFVNIFGFSSNSGLLEK